MEDVSAKTHRIAVILNRGAGMLRRSDPLTIQTQLSESFAAAGHQTLITVCDAPEIRALIARHLKNRDVEIIVVGGGDGTASASAAELVGTEITLGVLPLGTMNFFARALKIPLDINTAIPTLAKARQKLVDVGRVGDHVFLHQVAFGLPPRLVRIREKMTYGSRIGKMLASLRAFFLALRRPPLLALEIKTDGETKIVHTPALVVSNNIYGDNHLPFPDRMDEGVLGIYACTSRNWTDLTKLAADVLLGNWRNNPNVEMHRAHEVVISRAHRKLQPLSASIDGELVRLFEPVKIETVARSLKVLVPTEDANGPGTQEGSR